MSAAPELDALPLPEAVAEGLRALSPVAVAGTTMVEPPEVMVVLALTVAEPVFDPDWLEVADASQ